MLNLLKAEYKKFFQGKLFIAIAILVLVFPLASGFLYGVVLKSLDNGIISVTAQAAFLGSFNPLNNLGLIFLIFMLIIIMADFSQNTIRNKVIVGYSKNKIYLASTIFTLSIAFIVVTIFTFLTYLIVGMVIGFGDTKFTETLQYWAVLIFATMSLYAFVQFTVYVFKSLGASLGVIFGSLLGILLIFGILSISMAPDARRIVVTVIPLLQLTYIMPLQDIHILWMILTSVLFTAAIIILGLFLNKRLDYK